LSPKPSKMASKTGLGFTSLASGHCSACLPEVRVRPDRDEHPVPAAALGLRCHNLESD
jgi:hypothetical protein